VSLSFPIKIFPPPVTTWPLALGFDLSVLFAPGRSFELGAQMPPPFALPPAVFDLSWSPCNLSPRPQLPLGFFFPPFSGRHVDAPPFLPQHEINFSCLSVFRFTTGCGFPDFPLARTPPCVPAVGVLCPSPPGHPTPFPFFVCPRMTLSPLGVNLLECLVRFDHLLPCLRSTPPCHTLLGAPHARPNCASSCRSLMHRTKRAQHTPLPTVV